MLQPESTLLQLVEQLEATVRDKEAELADFELRAQEYLDALRADISRTRKRIELFRSEVDAMKSEKRPVAPFLAATAIRPELSDDQENQSNRIRDAARAILAEAGRPMMQSEIKAQMDERGIVIVSKKVIELIRAALRRDPEFKHIKGQGWILVDRGSQQ